MVVSFVVIGAVASVLTLIAFLFDGVLDLFDFSLPGDGSLSAVSVFGGVAVFGWVGLILQGVTDWPIGGVLAGAITAGLIVLLAFAWLTTMLRRHSASGDEVTELAGLTGLVTVAIEPDRSGVVRVMVAGAPRTVTAQATVPVPAGSQVRVTQSAGPGHAVVEPLPAP